MEDKLEVHYLMNPDVVVLTMGPNVVQLTKSEAESLFVQLGNVLQDMSYAEAEEQK